jgi:hypothetical protein
MMPKERVAIANPISKPAEMVAFQEGTVRSAMMTIATVAAVIANRNGISIGVQNRFP